MYKIAIVDDEKEAISILTDYIGKVLTDEKEYEITAYQSPTKFLNDYKTGDDIIFLDIRMPGIDGMKVAQKIRERDSHVILVFITSIAQYAIQGYEVSATDYILKPYEFNDFRTRFTHILELLNKRKENDDKLVLKSKDGYEILYKSDLIYVESDAHYLIYHTAEKTITERGSMKEIAQTLEGVDFASCNKSYIVNLRYVEKVDDLFVYLVKGEKLQISRLKKKSFMQALTNYYLRG